MTNHLEDLSLRTGISAAKAGDSALALRVAEYHLVEHEAAYVAKRVAEAAMRATPAWDDQAIRKLVGLIECCNDEKYLLRTHREESFIGQQLERMIARKRNWNKSEMLFHALLKESNQRLALENQTQKMIIKKIG